MSNLKLKIKQAVCYLCGHNDFSIEDVHNAQSKAVLEDINDLIPYAVCPCCCYTIEI